MHLSRVVDDSFRTDPASLLQPESTLTSWQRKVWVSVGALPLLRVGDIWRDGRFEMAPDYEIEEFESVEITSDTSVLIKAGLSLAGEGFLLPRAEHPWHMQCTQSYCVMATLRNEVRLIIPCMELIRFYFGSSSSLLSKLFLPPLNRDKLYSEGKFSKGSGHLKIELAAGIPGASAADVGRIFVDEAAWRTAVHVGASLLKASTAGLPAYPQAFFPFEGESDLVAAGKWLSFGDKPHATFLVYSLRSCSHPFPFKSLRYNLAAKPPTTWLDPSAAENLPHKRHARRTSKCSFAR